MYTACVCVCGCATDTISKFSPTDESHKLYAFSTFFAWKANFLKIIAKINFLVSLRYFLTSFDFLYSFKFEYYSSHPLAPQVLRTYNCFFFVFHNFPQNCVHRIKDTLISCLTLRLQSTKFTIYFDTF